MSKKYKNKICVYCAENMSSTGDHVFAREFFLPHERGNLPKVPSCDSCNNEKSELEHYLTAIMPFGGRHDTAQENLSTMVPKRLNRNRKLHQELQESRSHALSVETHGATEECMALPIDGQKLLDLFKYITKGLVWHHLTTLLTKEYSVEAISLTQYGEHFFEKNFMSLNSNIKIENNIGNNIFSYTGLQAVDIPQISVWQFIAYNGFKVTESSADHSEFSTKIGAITGPHKLIEDFSKAT